MVAKLTKQTDGSRKGPLRTDCERDREYCSRAVPEGVRCWYGCWGRSRSSTACRSRSAGRSSGGCWRHWRSAGARWCRSPGSPMSSGRMALGLPVPSTTSGPMCIGSGLRSATRAYVSRRSGRATGCGSTSKSWTRRTSNGWPMLPRPRRTAATLSAHSSTSAEPSSCGSAPRWRSSNTNRGQRRQSSACASGAPIFGSAERRR